MIERPLVTQTLHFSVPGLWFHFCKCLSKPQEQSVDLEKLERVSIMLWEGIPKRNLIFCSAGIVASLTRLRNCLQKERICNTIDR